MDITPYLDYIRNYTIDNDNIVSMRDSVDELNLKILYKRLHDAKDAFVLLYDNNFFTDAMLVAGHILETCATIYYIKSAKDRLLNARRYVAKSTVNSAFDILGVDTSELQDEAYKLTFGEFIDYLREVGHLILKPTPKEDKKALNNKILSQLSSTELSNNKKRSLIKQFYEMPLVNDYLNRFIAGAQKRVTKTPGENVQKIKESFNLFYVSYCRIKHANALLYPGEIQDNHLIINDNKEDLCVPAVFLSLDMISDTPSYFKM